VRAVAGVVHFDGDLPARNRQQWTVHGDSGLAAQRSGHIVQKAEPGLLLNGIQDDGGLGSRGGQQLG